MFGDLKDLKDLKDAIPGNCVGDQSIAKMIWHPLEA